jgi:hypothetical protein
MEGKWSMPWVFFAIMCVYGVFSILFAFKRPPEALDHFFKVPSIFVFLPERWVMPAGRIFVGLLCFAVSIFLYIKLNPVV